MSVLLMHYFCIIISLGADARVGWNLASPLAVTLAVLLERKELERASAPAVVPSGDLSRVGSEGVGDPSKFLAWL